MTLALRRRLTKDRRGFGRIDEARIGKLLFQVCRSLRPSPRCIHPGPITGAEAERFYRRMSVDEIEQRGIPLQRLGLGLYAVWRRIDYHGFAMMRGIVDERPALGGAEVVHI